MSGPGVATTGGTPDMLGHQEECFTRLKQLKHLRHLRQLQTWHFGRFRGRVYLGWNYNTFKSHRDRAGTEGVIEITLETG